MKLQKNQSQLVEFQIECEGTEEKIIPRLVLKSKDMSIVYEGTMSGKNATFEVSKLDKLFEGAKEADAEIEVIVEGKFFQPWKAKVEFETPISVMVTENKQPKVVKRQPRIKVTETHSDKNQIKEGYHKVKINGKTEEVLVTQVLTENGATTLKVVDKTGHDKTIRIK
jgi:hypothetical protein